VLLGVGIDDGVGLAGLGRLANLRAALGVAEMGHFDSQGRGIDRV